jgi:hypothetical protein
LATLLASGGAFLWRLMQRLERLESPQARQRIDIDASRSASEAAMFLLGARLTQVHDDCFRLRETIGPLPTRLELRDVGNHLAERLASLADRLDRAIGHRAIHCEPKRASRSRGARTGRSFLIVTTRTEA